MSKFFIYATLFVFAATNWGCRDSNNSKDSTQVSKMDDECLPIINSFFDKIKSGGYVKAMDDLLNSNTNIDQSDSSVTDLKEKFGRINSLSGEYIGYKILKKKSLDRDISIYSCLVKYQKKFYRYVFIFYMPEKEVKIYKFLFDDNLDIELEESLKLYI